MARHHIRIVPRPHHRFVASQKFPVAQRQPFFMHDMKMQHIRVAISGEIHDRLGVAEIAVDIAHFARHFAQQAIAEAPQAAGFFHERQIGVG